MAALTITAANVRSYGSIASGVAGGTITAGLAVYLNTSGQVVSAANTSAAAAAVCGIALNGASSNQPVEYHTGGEIDMGATVAIGKVYVLGTAGGVIPVDDVAGGEFITVLGVGTTAAKLLFGLVKSGVAAAGAVA
jgi:hypothetical protein